MRAFHIHIAIKKDLDQALTISQSRAVFERLSKLENLRELKIGYFFSFEDAFSDKDWICDWRAGLESCGD